MTLTTSSPVSLYSLLGNHPGTEALKRGGVSSPLVTFDFADVKAVFPEFKPMMRELKYDFGVRADLEGTADPTFHAPLDITG